MTENVIEFTKYLISHFYCNIYTLSAAFAPWRNFAMCSKIHFASKSCVILYWQRYCTALQQRCSGVSQTLRRCIRN